MSSKTRKKGTEKAELSPGVNLQTLPNDIIANIIGRLPTRQQLQLALSFPQLRDGLAAAWGSPLTRLDHISNELLCVMPPPLPRGLHAATERHLRCSSSHLRVLRLHPSFPLPEMRDLLQKAGALCPQIRHLAFSDNGALDFDTLSGAIMNLRSLERLEVAHSGRHLMSWLHILPSSCKRINLTDFSVMQLDQLFDEHLLVDCVASPASQRHVHVVFSFNDTHEQAGELVQDFLDDLENQSKFLQTGINILELYLPDYVLRGMPRLMANGPTYNPNMCEIATTVKYERRISGHGKITYSPIETNATLSGLIKSGNLLDPDEPLFKVYSLSIGWEHFFSDESFQMPLAVSEQAAVQLKRKCNGITELGLRGITDRPGRNASPQAFRAACCVLKRHSSITKLNLSREVLSSQWHDMLREVLTAGDFKTVRLCDPRLTGMHEVLESELKGLPDFLDLLATCCPQLESLYVHRPGPGSVKWKLDQKQAMINSWDAIARFERRRPEVDMSTLVLQVEDWSVQREYAPVRNEEGRKPKSTVCRSAKMLIALIPSFCLCVYVVVFRL